VTDVAAHERSEGRSAVEPGVATPSGGRACTPNRARAVGSHEEAVDRRSPQLGALSGASERPQTERSGGRACVGFCTDERQRLARDLHDGAQSELVSLVIRLKQVEEDPSTPTALAGTAPRSNADAEPAVYFACTEAFQNVAKHAGDAARVNVSLHYDHAMLTVRVEDDGLGFELAQIREGAGLRNLRDRIDAVGGCTELTSSPGRGTTLTISLPWPRRQPRTDRGNHLRQRSGRVVRLLVPRS